MDKNQKTALNTFFVYVFNQILSWEEQSFKEMGISEISLRELHVIEAVYSLKENGKNRMSEIAKYLAITPGSLTTAVNCLVKKGYLSRENLPEDRRVIMINPTDKAFRVNESHKQFHEKMIDSIEKYIDDESADAVIKTLEGLSGFFAEKEELRRR
ncbi:MAG: MarR family transcriptional regulator [Clostridia bacterium]|nr:MarR family transcriptional regulator [Clostridia bacterium]MBQ9737731.1 MarR family transcriptional regulator [Clostridia bacterium]